MKKLSLVILISQPPGENVLALLTLARGFCSVRNQNNLALTGARDKSSLTINGKVRLLARKRLRLGPEGGEG